MGMAQYPNAIRKLHVYPKHLGKEWYEMIIEKIRRRIKYKGLYKETKDPKYNSLQEMGKLSLNGGSYGRLGLKGDWQEDPCALLEVTIGCQLEILMIGEALILKGFEVVSFNTDGFDTLVPKNRLQEYFDICNYYEKKIGNEEMGNLEYTKFEWILQTSVNSYLAKKLGEYKSNGEFKPHYSVDKDDEYKCKGEFEYWKELNKNSSFSIIPYTFLEYYARGADVEEVINNHKDIFDFCARSSSGKTYYHVDTTNSTLENQVILPKIIRYYVSKNGIHIKKIVQSTVTTGANDQNVAPAEFKKTVCNELYPESHELHLSQVDRQWYIDKVNEILYAVENGKKPKIKQAPKEQLSMF